MKKYSFQNAAAYIRVSTHAQEELSPDAQKRLLKEYAKNNDLLLSDEFIFLDSGISGRTAEKRPAFMKMIELAKAKKFDVILVWKFSRFARNQEESIVYKSMLRNKCGVEVISITEPITNDIYGGLIERIIEWMDEFYSIRLAEDVTRGMTEKALRGGFQASPALGYKVVQKGCPPVIDQEQAKTVRFIYDRYIRTTDSFFDIARLLNQLGYKTRNGGDFETRTVQYILQNPIYKGYVRWNRSDANGKVIKDESEWIVKKGDFEPIIPEEVWEKANQRLRREYHPKGSRPVSKNRHWLSGLIKCSNCGRSLATSIHKDRRYGRYYTNFQCYGYTKGKCAVSHHISEKRLLPILLETLKEDASKKSVPFEILEQPSLDPQKEQITEQLLKIQEKEKRIKAAYRNGIDTLEEYKENKEILQKEREQLEQKIKDLPSNDPKERNLPKEIHGVYDVLVSDSASKEEKAAAIRSIVNKIVFNKETQTIDIYYHLL